MQRLLALAVICGVLGACGSAAVDAPLPVNSQGFPMDWPIQQPPGSIVDCENGEVAQDDALFSVVFCLPDDLDPFTASQTYLADLEREGFVERDPGQFIAQQQTFLDGNGIEIFYQLEGGSPAFATMVLIRPAG